MALLPASREIGPHGRMDRWKSGEVLASAQSPEALILSHQVTDSPFLKKYQQAIKRVNPSIIQAHVQCAREPFNRSPSLSVNLKQGMEREKT
jgi:hypothetical protein